MVSSQSQTLPPGFQRNKLSDGSQEFFINMGPQHPSTHGVLRLVVKLDGETVREVVPHLGYIHRGTEKMGESQSYLQYIHLTDRHDYMCSHMNNLGVCMAIEKALNMGIPERGEYIRVMVNELQRISSHLIFWSAFGGDLGAVSAFLYGFKEREKITQIFDEMAGARLTMNFFRPGGSIMDVQDGFVDQIRDVLKSLDKTLLEYDKLITGNYIVRERTEGIGLLSKEDAISYGCSGPVLRASGVDYDVRKKNPYSAYGQFDFKVPVYQEGDTLARYLIRMDEIRESMRILEQACDKFPSGPYRSKEKPSIKLPEGSHYSEVETAKGIYGTYFVALKGDKPYRVKTRSPNLSNLHAFPDMVVGHKVADVISVLSTLDLVIPDIDR